MKVRFKRLGLYSLLMLLGLLMACDQLEGFEPTILSLTASPSSLEAGETSTLEWNIIGGAEDVAVTLTPGDADLDKIGTYEVTPSETTTYTLSVGGEGSSTTKEVTVKVGEDGDNEGGEEPTPEPTEPEPTEPEPTEPEPTDPEPTDPEPTDPEPTPDTPSCEGFGGIEDGELLQALINAIEAEGLGIGDSGSEFCSSLAKLESLSLGFDPQAGQNPNPPIENLKGLENAVNLTELELVDIIAPLEPVVALPNLKSLTIRNDSDSIAPLAQSDLESISFSFADVVSDLSSLTEIESLKSVSISDAEQLGVEIDITSVANIPNLETLDLTGNFEIPVPDGPTDITPLTSATGLKSLSFTNLLVPDLSVISELTELTELTFNASGDVGNGVPQLSTLDFVAPLTKLEMLDVGGAVDTISDISALLELPWAAEDDSVNLQGAPVPAEQIEALREKVATVEF